MSKNRNRRARNKAIYGSVTEALRQRSSVADPVDFSDFEAITESLRSRNVSTLGEMELRLDTLDVEARTVDAVIATGDPVRMIDLDGRGYVQEVLVLDGMEPTQYAPLLNSHRRRNHDDVFGSISNIRIDKQTGQVIAQLRFAEPTDDDNGREIGRAWGKVRDGHLRGVSAGYRILEARELKPGQSAVINGRRYTAGNERLRVITKWALREASLVAIGADPRALTRAEPTELERTETVERLREYLESVGLRSGATIDEAMTFWVGLDGERRERADEIATDIELALRERYESDGQRSTPTPTIEHVAELQSGPSATEAATEAREAERQRVAAIMDAAGRDAPELQQRAINEGWSENRFNRALLDHLRETRGTGNGQQGAAQSTVGIHTRAADDINADVLALGMMMGHGEGIRMDAEFWASDVARNGQVPTVMLRDINNPDRQRAMELAYRVRSRSLVDLCGDALQLAGRTVPHDRDERIRAAMATNELNFIFSTNVNARLLSSYQETEDSTLGWTSEVDRPDFKTNDVGILGKMPQLKKRPVGKDPEQLSQAATYESYKVAQYAGEFSIDEQEIINDSFGAFSVMSPEEMGAAARRLRPDLVYSILLANAALQDGTALFHADHGNLESGALSTANLESYLAGMMNQRQNGAPLNVRGRYLIVNPALKFSARQMVKSSSRDSATGSMNPLESEMLEVRADTRIGATGVSDPTTDPATSRTGSATLYFISARPGENGAKTIEVGYLRGRGRAPRITSWMSGNGLCMNWTVTMDIGAKALDYRGMVKSTGA
jgi:hypothetical protein